MSEDNPSAAGPDPGADVNLDSRRIAAHLTTVADILVEMAEEIEELGTTLCVDPAILGSHMATLQSIDLIAQKQRWLATLLHADNPLSAVQTIGVEALKARFASTHTH